MLFSRTSLYNPTIIFLIQSQAPEESGSSGSGFQSFGSRQRQRGSQLASQQVSRGGSQVSRGSQQTSRGSQSGVDGLRGSLGTRADLLSQVGPFFLCVPAYFVGSSFDDMNNWYMNNCGRGGGKQYLILVTTDFYQASALFSIENAKCLPILAKFGYFVANINMHFLACFLQAQIICWNTKNDG